MNARQKRLVEARRQQVEWSKRRAARYRQLKERDLNAAKEIVRVRGLCYNMVHVAATDHYNNGVLQTQWHNQQTKKMRATATAYANALSEVGFAHKHAKTALVENAQEAEGEWEKWMENARIVQRRADVALRKAKLEAEASEERRRDFDVYRRRKVTSEAQALDRSKAQTLAASRSRAQQRNPQGPSSPSPATTTVVIKGPRIGDVASKEIPNPVKKAPRHSSEPTIAEVTRRAAERTQQLRKTAWVQKEERRQVAVQRGDTAVALAKQEADAAEALAELDLVLRQDRLKRLSRPLGALDSRYARIERNVENRQLEKAFEAAFLEPERDEDLVWDP